jgi:hypothetical protein
VERLDALRALLRRPDTGTAQVVAALLSPPLRATQYAAGFGTLYTAVYQPAIGMVDLYWPGASWRLSFDDFQDDTRHVPLDAGWDDEQVGEPWDGWYYYTPRTAATAARPRVADGCWLR